MQAVAKLMLRLVVTIAKSQNLCSSEWQDAVGIGMHTWESLEVSGAGGQRSLRQSSACTSERSCDSMT